MKINNLKSLIFIFFFQIFNLCLKLETELVIRKNYYRLLKKSFIKKKLNNEFID